MNYYCFLSLRPKAPSFTTDEVSTQSLDTHPRALSRITSNYCFSTSPPAILSTNPTLNTAQTDHFLSPLRSLSPSLPFSLLLPPRSFSSFVFLDFALRDSCVGRNSLESRDCHVNTKQRKNKFPSLSLTFSSLSLALLFILFQSLALYPSSLSIDLYALFLVLS